MVSGTARQKKCYPVHAIAQQLPQQVQDNILGFHSLTGCDSTSSLAGFGKKKCWGVFEHNPNLLGGVGRDGGMAEIEEFMCTLYGAPDPHGGVNKARNDMFDKGQKALEKLPPTRDALELHLERSNYQAKVWLQANVAIQTVGSPADTGGWRVLENESLEVVWSRLPSIPDACIELVTCGCKSKCKTASCRCSKGGQRCIPACKCNAEDCRNPAGLN
jgi:hypothetical protein